MPERADAIGIDAVSVGAIAKIGQGGIAIFNLRGEWRITRQAIIDGCQRKALGNKLQGEMNARFQLAAAVPATAMDPKNQWKGTFAGRHIEVERLHRVRLRSCLGSGDIGDINIMTAPCRQFCDQLLDFGRNGLFG